MRRKKKLKKRTTHRKSSLPGLKISAGQYKERNSHNLFTVRRIANHTTSQGCLFSKLYSLKIRSPEMIHGWCLTTKTFNFPEQQGDKIYLHLFFFSKGGSWVGGKTCSWLHNSTTARETNAHKPSWTSLSPWLLLFHVQCIRHHTVLSTPMETSIPSKLWISWGQSEAARIYKVFWEKQLPHLVRN